jgi:hypothetical protein
MRNLEKVTNQSGEEWQIFFGPYVSAVVLGYVQKAYTYWESGGGVSYKLN